MKFVPSTPSKAPAFALTSMLDVIFLLLCFFVTISVYSQFENDLDIKLPKAQTADERLRDASEIVVNVLDSGRVMINGAEMELNDLTVKLTHITKFWSAGKDDAQIPVIIRAGKDTRYEDLVKVIDACREGNIWNFRLATVPTEGAK